MPPGIERSPESYIRDDLFLPRSGFVQPAVGADTFALRASVPLIGTLGITKKSGHGHMSPTIFRERGYRFYFFSREEPRMHVHIMSQSGEAKYWLEPDLELAKNHRLTRTELREIEQLIEAHFDELKTAWKTHFGG